MNRPKSVEFVKLVKIGGRWFLIFSTCLYFLGFLVLGLGKLVDGFGSREVNDGSLPFCFSFFFGLAKVLGFEEGKQMVLGLFVILFSTKFLVLGKGIDGLKGDGFGLNGFGPIW